MSNCSDKIIDSHSRIAKLEEGHERNKEDIRDLQRICKQVETSNILFSEFIKHQQSLNEKTAKNETQIKYALMVLAVGTFSNNPQLTAILKSLL